MMNGTIEGSRSHTVRGERTEFFRRAATVLSQSTNLKSLPRCGIAEINPEFLVAPG